MTINENLRNLRLAANMTQEQAAEQLGITRQGLSSYETGRTLPDIEMLEHIAALYDTNLETLIYGRDKKANSYNLIKTVALAVYISITVLTLISSAVLWSANHYFEMPAGTMTDASRQILEIRIKLSGIWGMADRIILTIAFFSGVFFVIYCACKKCRYRLRTRLVSVILCSATIMLIALFFGLLDPVYPVVNYLFTPLFVIARLCIFFLLDMLVEIIQKHMENRNNADKSRP